MLASPKATCVECSAYIAWPIHQKPFLKQDDNTGIMPVEEYTLMASTRCRAVVGVTTLLSPSIQLKLTRLLLLANMR